MPSAAWWEANLNKPVEVSVEDDGVFAENAGDEPETAKTDLTQTASNAVVPAKNDAKPSLFSGTLSLGTQHITSLLLNVSFFLFFFYDHS